MPTRRPAAHDWSLWLDVKIMFLGEGGPTATTHLIFDVTGYFVP